MASRRMNMNGLEFEIASKTVRCRIFPDSTNAPTFTSAGGVASVARSAAGKFLITLQDPYRKCREFHCSYSTAADNVDLYAQPGAVSNLGTSTDVTAVVKLKAGANNTDAAAAAADNFIDVTLVFDDSDAGPT